MRSSARWLGKSPTTILDRVYEHISLPPPVVNAIDTQQFQRLRGLKQLGASSFLYPGAVHTRFEHSIGVAHLAGVFVKQLRDRQPELNINEDDVIRLMLAGLCHDLGHGPFSHLFEDVVVANLGVSFHHEDMSTKLLQRVAQETGMSQSDCEIVSALMNGTTCPALKREGKSWMKEIVANKRNGIDVDRIDYFMRDALCCFGKATSDVRPNRLFNSARVFPGDGDSDSTIAFQKKMVVTLRDFFSLRSRLHRHVYQHKVVKAVGHMIGDVLGLAGSAGFPLLQASVVTDVDQFTATGDWILDAINASTDSAMIPAKNTLYRLRRRNLYPILFEGHFESTVFYELKKESPKGVSARIAAGIDELMMQSSGGTSTSPVSNKRWDSPFIVDIVTINHGMKAMDPLKHITFFDPKVKEGGGIVEPVGEIESPLYRPMQFEEQTLLIFARTQDPATLECLRNAVAQWKQKKEVRSWFRSGTLKLS